jgi:hypothetical protein
LNIKELLPTHKSDIEAIEKIGNNYTISEIEPIVPELLTWVQDSNWPIGIAVAKLLQPYVNEISIHISTILDGNDDVWSYWCIEMLILESPQRVTSTDILDSLKRIISRKQVDDLDGDLKTKAQEAIDILKTSSK